LFATFAGGYSRKPLPAQPDLLGDAERRLHEGILDADGFRAIADAFVREVLDEMAVVGLGIVGDGGVRAQDRIIPWIRGLEGLEAGGLTTLPDGEAATRPLVTDTVRWTRPITVRDWQFADGQTNLLVKQTMIGPYSLAALAETDPRRRSDLALQLGEALNLEIQALAAAGCPMVEIDEPHATQIGDDTAEFRSFRASNERLFSGLESGTGLHLSLGLRGGQVDAAGYEHMIDLPYQSYLVDVLAGPSAWRFIDAVPPARGIIVGSADARTASLDETEVHVWAMAWAAQGGRGPDRVGCAPNGSLGLIDRHFAHRKCLRLGEAVKIGSMGPLQEVAEALDEDPAQSKLPALRALARVVESARAS
jgi:5-methyltetrahydropteroyltriglutamate--homocysteine methyltransferase